MSPIGRRVALAASLLAMSPFAAPFVAMAQTSGEPVNVGLVTSITGIGAGLGLPQRNGALLAEKDINAKGGIGGRPIKVIVEDDASSAETALSKANDLVHNKKVVALLGPTLTANTVAVGSLTDPLKFPQIAFSGQGPVVELSRKCLFHTSPPQVLNARALLEAARALNARKIGVLYDSGFGTVVMSFMRKFTDEYGVKIVAEEKFEIAATDTMAQAAKVKAAQPDVVMVISTSATPFRAVRQLQMKQTIIGSLGTSSYEYVNAMGSAADNIIVPEFMVAEEPLPRQKEFVELYKKEYNTLPKHHEAAAWDMMHILAETLTKLGPTAAPEAVCKALQGPHSGVMTTWDFSALDMTGITLSGYIFSKLTNGKYSRTDIKVQNK
jgi:branched-chain amino acid transport system substrate-binding protein